MEETRTMMAMTAETLQRLATFVAIADAGSVAKASDTLGVEADHLMADLTALEHELGISLALRTERSLRLTAAGTAVRDAAAATLEAASTLGDEAPVRMPVTDPVAITLPVELATHWLPPRLAALPAPFRGGLLTIHASDAPVLLDGGPYDIAVRACTVPPGEPGGPDTLPLTLVARAVSCAAVSETSAHISGIPLLYGPTAAPVEALHRRSRAPMEVTADSAIVVDNRDVALAMAREGLGAALVTELAAAEDIASGRLEPVLPECDFGALGIVVVLRDRRPSAAARAVAETLQRPVGRPAPSTNAFRLFSRRGENDPRSA